MNLNWKKFYNEKPEINEKIWFRKPASKAHAIGIFVGLKPTKKGYRPCIKNNQQYVLDFNPEIEWDKFKVKGK